MHNDSVKKLEMENKLLKEEIKELQNAEIVRSLKKSLERISKGRFITKNI